MKWLSSLLRGGSDELGWDDLVGRVAEATGKLARYGERGVRVFPDDVAVRIEVGEGSIEPVRRFVEGPELDREVGAALANRFDCAPHALPARHYEVVVGARTRVVAAEGPAHAWQAQIEGGDRAGERLLVPRGRTEITFGRGAWHGADESLRNDWVVCEAVSFVSRRAGRLLVSGQRLEVEALGQGETLVVRRAEGDSVRPVRTAQGRVLVRSGDAIELGDGAGQAVRLVFSRVTLAPAEPQGAAGGDPR